MNGRLLALAIACVFVLPGSSSAQGHTHQGEMQQDRMQQGHMQHGMMMGQGMMGMMGMMLPGPSFLLEQKDPLELGDEQVQRLEELKSQLSEAHQAHMSRMGPLHEQARDALHGEQPDLGAYESALKALADEHVQMQVEMARASQEAMAVLTETQRSNVHFGLRLMHGMRERMMHQGQMMQQMMERMMQGGMMQSGDARRN